MALSLVNVMHVLEYLVINKSHLLEAYIKPDKCILDPLVWDRVTSYMACLIVRFSEP